VLIVGNAELVVEPLPPAAPSHILAYLFTPLASNTYTSSTSLSQSQRSRPIMRSTLPTPISTFSPFRCLLNLICRLILSVLSLALPIHQPYRSHGSNDYTLNVSNTEHDFVPPPVTVSMLKPLLLAVLFHLWAHSDSPFVSNVHASTTSLPWAQ
jgi:hypothetical protein